MLITLTVKTVLNNFFSLIGGDNMLLQCFYTPFSKVKIHGNISIHAQKKSIIYKKKNFDKF